MRNCKKTFIVAASVVKGIRMKEVNKQLHNFFAKLSSFPGATLKHLKCCVVPSLIDKLIAKIANEIGDMVVLYHGYGVNDIFISAMICRRSKVFE